MGKKYDGSLLYDTRIDTKGFKKGVDGIKSLAKAGTVAVAALGTAVTAVGYKAIKAYGDYEQLVGGVQTLFKESADDVVKNAAQAFKTAQMSANVYMDTVTSFSASLLQSVGGDTQKAMKMADQAVIDMADNANKMGTEMQRIQDAYQGFAKQNFTMLDNLKLGYGGTKGEMERLLADAERIKAANGEMVSYSIDNFGDMTEAIHVIQTEMGITGTSAEEASQTIQGSINMLKGAWENLLTGLTDPSQDIDKLIDDVYNSLVIAAKNLKPRIEQLLGGIGTVITKLAPPLVEAIGELIPQLLPTVIEGTVEVINAIASTAVENMPRVLEAIYTGLQSVSPAAAQVFEPVILGMSEIVEHSELVVAAIAGIAAAYASFNIAQWGRDTVTWWKNVEVSITSASSIGQIALGVLTGKISLATAKTILLHQATNLLKSPAGIAGIASVVVGAVSALITYAKNADTVSNRLNKLTKAHDEAIKSIDDTAVSEMSQAETAMQLKNRLYELEEQLRSGTLTEEEAKKAKDDFTASANSLNEIIPGIINNIGNETNEYYIQRGEVDALTESFYKLAYAKAMVNAYQSKINKTAEALVSAKEELKKAEKDKTGVIKNVNGEVAFEWEKSAYKKAKNKVSGFENELNGYISEIQNWQGKLNGLMQNTAGSAEKAGTRISNAAGTAGAGVEKAAKSASSDAKKAAKDAERTEKERLKEVEEEAKKARDRNFKDLKNQLDLEEITEQEYYDKLAEYRDKYFAEGSDEWKDYTFQINEYHKKLIDEAAKKQKELIEKVKEMRDELAATFRGSDGEWFKTTQTIIKGIGKNGEDVTYTNHHLSDFSEEIDELERYRKAIQSLKALGNVPEALFSEFASLSVKEGLKQAETILNYDEEGRNKFLSGYAMRDKKALEVANELNPILNGEKMREAGIVSAESFNEGFILKSTDDEERTKFVQKLEEQFGTLPDEWYKAGGESADSFERGFFEKLPEIAERIRNTLLSSMSRLGEEMAAAVIGRSAVQGANSGNTYHNTYTFNSSRDTTTQQLFAAKRMATLDRLRGTN